MYSVILAVALTSGNTAPGFFFQKLHALCAKWPPAPCAMGCDPCGMGCGPFGYPGYPNFGYPIYPSLAYPSSLGGPMHFVPAFGGFAVPGPYPCYGYSGYGTADGGGYAVGNSWNNQIPVFPPVAGMEATPSEKPSTNSQTPNKDDKTPELPDPDKKGPDKKEPDMKEPDMKEPEKKEKESGSLAPNRARVVIELPADARLYVDGHLTKTTSAVRSYRTPELAAGETYYYSVRAEIEMDGKVVSQTRRLVVRAGEVVRERFDDPRTVQNTGAWVVASRNDR